MMDWFSVDARLSHTFGRPEVSNYIKKDEKALEWIHCNNNCRIIGIQKLQRKWTRAAE
jgi:hypothetical protein